MRTCLECLYFSEHTFGRAAMPLASQKPMKDGFEHMEALRRIGSQRAPFTTMSTMRDCEAACTEARFMGTERTACIRTCASWSRIVRHGAP